MTRRALLSVATAVAVGVVLAGGAWAVAAAPPPPAGPGRLTLPDGGVATVEQVVSAARPAHAMPGMGVDTDPVADGDRRVSIDVTLRAADRPFGYAVDRFSLRVPGGKGRAPHRSVLPGDELPAGTQLSGTLIFDVAIDARAGVLAYDGGGSADVALPPETGPGPEPSGSTDPSHDDPSHTDPSHDDPSHGGSAAATPATTDEG